MSLLSLSLLVTKVGIGIGLVSLAASIPLSIANKNKNLVATQQVHSSTDVSRERGVADLENTISEKVLQELASKTCREAYRKKLESELGIFYICPLNLSQESQYQKEMTENDWGYLLYVDSEAIIKSSGDTENISELLKKVVSITYEKEETEEQGRIIFRLDGETEKKTLIVDSTGNWNFFEFPVSFNEMKDYLTSIYDAP